MSTHNLATAKTASTDSRPNAEQLNTGSSSDPTHEQPTPSPWILAPYPAAPGSSAACSSVGEPGGLAPSPLDDDEDAAQLMQLLRVVQQQRRELEQQPAGMLVSEWFLP